uniref:CRC domain-containing protein n=1 Tax=Globodera rostochiensis TaxID=31243 RepID=A0A914GTG5_GLORO
MFEFSKKVRLRGSKSVEIELFYSILQFYLQIRVQARRLGGGKTSNYENEQEAGEYEEDDGQYLVDGDDSQYYEEYVEVGSEAAVPAYQDNSKSRTIVTSNTRTPSGLVEGRVVGAATQRPFTHRSIQNALPISGANYSFESRHLPSYFGHFRQREPSQAHHEVYGTNYPIISGGFSLPAFLSKPPKSSKSRKLSTKRKPCNCTKSMCLKLYCDCFSNGEFCLDCNCKDCHNNLEHEAERSRAIKQSLERNPSAFKPKIGVAAKSAGKTIDMERLHQRGCHCKRSNCLKNYCECYEAKVPCTERCKCQSCRNTENDRHNKFKDKFTTTAGGLAQLAAAAAAESRACAGTPFSEDDASDICVAEEEMTRQANPKTQAWFYMTEDVIEATTMCLVSQAQEFEQNLSEDALEKSVLKDLPQKAHDAALLRLSSTANGV